MKNIGDLWIKSDPSITAIKAAADANHYYKTLVNTNEWNKMSEDKTKLIALMTKVNELPKKNQQLESKLKSNSEEHSGKSSGKEKKSNSSGGVQQHKLTPEQLKAQMEWCTVKKGNTCTRNGSDWVWCGIGHGREGKGLYMPKGHYHAKWAENKKEKDAKFAERRAQKDKAGNDNAGNKGSNANSIAKKLALSKHLTAALTIQIGISDADASKFAEKS